MKISFNPIVPVKEQSTNVNQTNSFSNCVKKNFDTVTIHSNEEEISDQIFAKKLTTSMLNDINNKCAEPDREEKLRLLQQQIQSGTYKPDSITIANKILLLK
ncbi:MAG TPA: hypothetical protein DIT54_05870 [Lachnospiraceae bacterium]|nr:hypothetical protein [Lachnospiraceae bacterium]